MLSASSDPWIKLFLYLMDLQAKLENHEDSDLFISKILRMPQKPVMT